jgi:hypothetical protein
VGPTTRQISSKVKKRNLSDGSVTWPDIVEAIDIVFFWITMIYTLLITLILGVVAVNGEDT